MEQNQVVWPVHKMMLLSAAIAFVLVVIAIAAQSVFGINIQQLAAGVITSQFLMNGVQAAHNTSVINSPNNGLFPPPTASILGSYSSMPSTAPSGLPTGLTNPTALPPPPK